MPFKEKGITGFSLEEIVYDFQGSARKFREKVRKKMRDPFSRNRLPPPDWEDPLWEDHL